MFAAERLKVFATRNKPFKDLLIAEGWTDKSVDYELIEELYEKYKCPYNCRVELELPGKYIVNGHEYEESDLFNELKYLFCINLPKLNRSESEITEIGQPKIQHCSEFGVSSHWSNGKEFYYLYCKISPELHKLIKQKKDPYYEEKFYFVKKPVGCLTLSVCK